jgi:hypothetical protein
MYVPAVGPEGVEWLAADSLSELDRSTLGSHLNDIGRFLATADIGYLIEYEGLVIGGIPLLTDPDLIEQYAETGELEIEKFYMPEVPR